MMTPDSSPTADGSPPLPILGDLAKGTVEHDLWAFDEVEETATEAPAVRLQAADSLLPTSRAGEKMRARQLMDRTAPTVETVEDAPKVKPQPKASPSGQSALKKPGQDFDDLDSWEEATPPPPAPLLIRVNPELQSESEITADPAVSVPLPKGATDRVEISPEIAGGITPQRLVSQLKLSFIECCGLVLLLGLLGAGAVAVYVFTIHRLPSASELAKKNEFPVQGEHFSVLAAGSFWREPISSDTARRGTQMLPVLTLKAGGGPAEIRVFFRDSEGELVGDAVTRTIKEGGDLEIAATAGFEDRGMHAAYRTDQGPRWTIEIFESPAGKSTGADFKKLFTLPVSTVCR
jgi:hypothetical protein